MPVASPRDFPSWMRMVERRLNELTSAGRGPLLTYIESGGGGGGGTGTVDRRTPAAPTGVTYQPAIYHSRIGEPLSQVTVRLNPVTKATDGTDLEVDYYELWGRPWDGTGTAPAYLLAATSRSEDFVAKPFEAGTVWQFRVRAVGLTTVNVGAWSTEQFVTMQADIQPPPRPSSPTVTSVAGVLRVEWDGLNPAGGRMPADFAYVEIAAGTVSSPDAITGRRMRGAGVEVFTNAVYGQTWYFRLRAVDTSGNISPWSGNGSATVTPLVDIGGVTIEEILAVQQETAQNAADAAAVAHGTALARRADADLAQADADRAQDDADLAQAFYLSTKAQQDEVMRSQTGRTSVVYAGSPPAPSTTVVWINTASSTAWVSDGVDWLPANDPEVDAALAQVLDAQSNANEVQAEADLAQVEADQADQAADTAEAAAALAALEARQALETATATYQSAAGSNRITYSFEGPPADYSGAQGDTWFQHDVTGRVVGYWQWVGGAWEPRTVGSQIISNLDVGKLTAGAASIDTLAAQQIAAQTAEFLEARAEWFQANKIEADWIGFGAIHGQHIGVGAVAPESLVFGVEELSPNPMWIDTAMRLRFPAGTGMVYDSTPSLLQRGQNFVLTMSPGATRTMPLSVRVPCTPGEKFYLRHESRHTGANWAASLGLEFYDVDGNLLDMLTVTGMTTDPVNAYVPYEDVIQAPHAAATAALVAVAGVGTNGSWSMSATSWRRVMASTGPGGQRLEISPAAIRLWGSTDEGQPSVEISTTGAEVITLRDPDTDLSVTVLDSAGNVSAKVVNAADDMSVQGRSIFDILNDHPYGTLAKTKLVSNITLTTTAKALTSCDIIMPGSGPRQLRLIIGVESTANAAYATAFDLKFSATTTANTANTTHTTIDGYTRAGQKWDQWVYEFNSDELGVNALGTRFLSALVCGRTDGAGATSNTVQAVGGNSPSDGTFLIVEDVGPAVPTGRQTTGSGGEAIGLGTRTSAATAPKWYQTYKGDGAQYTAYPERHYQGYYLAANGVMKSAIGAPDQMFADLNGATVEWIKIYLYADHWWSASGGIAVLGTHNSSTKPTAFPGVSGAHSVAFGRDQGIEITLPSAWYASFKSGTHRGVTLHANNSTSSDYYGYFRSADTYWKWKYTK